MPALSQNFTFTVNNTSTVAVNYPNTGTTALTFISDKAKGDGYFGNSDGFHSVQLQTTNFIGKIEIQGTLSVDPTVSDWFSLNLQNNFTTSTSTLIYNTGTTTVLGYNFIANTVWVRCKISEFTQGTVNFVRYNY
jgi:hypothetical protein